MTSSQYKNIIIWTLFLNPELDSADSLDAARVLFNNLGVAFPHGTYKSIIELLNTEKYLGWRICSKEKAQKYANIGITAIGIDDEKIILILPDNNTNSLAAIPNPDKIKKSYTLHTSEMNGKEHEKLSFFAYCYGYKLEDKL